VPYAFDHLNLIQETLRRSPFGLITDVDGTISKTAPTPEKARVSLLCRRYLERLGDRLALVAAISGRAVSQIRDMIGIDGIVYIGSHGLERWSHGQAEFLNSARSYTRVIESVIRELTPLLSTKGIRVENKGVTATIHYRLCPEPELFERKILDAVEGSPQARSLRVIRGKMAIDLLPPIEVNKGTATLDLIREYHLQGGLYLGDDSTDVDAFEAIHTARRDLDFGGLAIGVTSPEMPKRLVAEADFTLNGVSDVARFLKWLFQSFSQSG
jgi:trehalose 6-phosphate phosphatase